jgi:cytochrome c biogenesis protein
VFVRDGALYGFKGLAGRLGPIGVHASMLAIMGGVAWGGLSGWKGSAMAPQGSTFLLADAVRPASPLARLPDGAPCPQLR